MLEYYKTIEASIKKYILDNYGKYLSDNQKKLLNEKSYINDEVSKISNINKLFNHLANQMLDDLLNHECYYTLDINEDDSVKIPCFNRLKEILINYYIKDLSNKVKFKPNINLKLAHQIDEVKQLNDTFDNIVDKNVFIKTANELLEIDELFEFASKCIEYDVNTHLKEQTN